MEILTLLDNMSSIAFLGACEPTAQPLNDVTGINVVWLHRKGYLGQYCVHPLAFNL
jgi:hypothetical protein